MKLMRNGRDRGCQSSWLLAAVMVAAGGCVSLLGASDAEAARLQNSVAVFAALDKVTARISKRKVPLNTTDQFGSLRVTPRVCYSRPPDEQPKTTTFVEVDEVQLNGQQKRLFTGWMFAESPGLNAVEHPVFDVWLIGCEGAKQVSDGAGKPGQKSEKASDGRERVRRRRVRR
jgi:hypothetical protein